MRKHKTQSVLPKIKAALVEEKTSEKQLWILYVEFIIYCILWKPILLIDDGHRLMLRDLCINTTVPVNLPDWTGLD